MAPRFIKKTILALILALILSASLETAFRIYDYGFKYRDLESRYLGQEADLPFDMLFTYFIKKGYVIRDQKLIWRRSPKRKGRYRFGSLGFRIGDKGEPLRKKGDNTYRIILFGGSQPFGIGLNYENTYASRLEELFNKGPGGNGKRVEVINAAVPGYSTTQVLNFLKYHMIDYKPDLVIIDAGNNDGIPLSPEWPWSDNELIEKTASFQYRALGLLERSSFFWYYRSFLHKIRDILLSGKNGAQKPLSTRVPIEENLANLKEIKKIAGENRFEVFFVSQMYFDPETAGLARGFGSMEEPYIDIYARLKEKPDLEEYFIDSVHASGRGHKDIAALIYGYLRPLILEDLKQ